MGTTAQTEEAIVRWHEVVNVVDLDAARRAVTDPIVVSGSKGAGPISSDGFAEWITRSGIALRPRSYHPISTRVLVVKQDARWPQNTAWTRVATMFRVTDDRVSAALRFADLRAAWTSPTSTANSPPPRRVHSCPRLRDSFPEGRESG